MHYCFCKTKHGTQFRVSRIRFSGVLFMHWKMWPGTCWPAGLMYGSKNQKVFTRPSEAWVKRKKKNPKYSPLIKAYSFRQFDSIRVQLLRFEPAFQYPHKIKRNFLMAAPIVFYKK